MSAALRAGYKQTEVGVIPEDWDCVSFHALASPVRNAIVGGPFGSDLVSADYVNYGVPVIRGQNMSGGRYLQGPYVYVSKQKARTLEANLARPGDVVFTQRGTMGQVSLVPTEPYDQYLVSQSQMKVTLKPSQAIPDFAYCWFDSERGQRSIQLNTIQTGVPHINLGILKGLQVPHPPVSEQRAIATALSDVDALLSKLDALIAKKRDLKQAAMQQLLTGQTRLPGFNGEWETKRLGDVGDCLRGVTYKGDSDLWPHDTAQTKRLLRSNNVQNAAVVFEDMQFVNSDRVSGHQLLRPNDILICMANGSKALVGKAGLFSVSDGYGYTFGAFMGCFRSNTAASNSSFVFYLFQTGRYRNYINNLLAGSSINNLSPGSIESLEFDVPTLPEQTAIASVLSDMDAELTALEARRDKTRALKQGMMQELLTGRIRLV